MNSRQIVEDEEEIDILELLMVLKAHMFQIVLSALVCGVIAMVYTTQLIHPTYQASIRMIVNSRQNAYTNITISDVKNSSELVATYAAVIKNNRVMDRVIQKMGLDMDWVTLNRRVSVNAVGQTPVMDIIVNGPDPEEARQIVNTIAEVAPELIVDAVEAGSCKIISDAYTSGEPISPNVKKNTMVGILFGGVLCAGIYLLLHLLDDKINSEEQLAEVSSAAALSTVPREVGLITPESSFAMKESIIRLRTNFIYATMNGEHRVVVFTSCQPGEGKSTLVLNLADSLAKLGRKVLVLDCELRRSVMTKYLADQQGDMTSDRREGMSEVLSSQREIEEVLIHMEGRGFDIVTAGKHAPNPTELIDSERMREILRMMRERYDFILLDAPPVLAVSDPVILSTMADGAVFVVQHKTIARKQLTYAMTELQSRQAKILGTILNKYDIRKDFTSKRQSGHYYSYYN